MLKAYYRLTKPGIVYANALTAASGFLFAWRTGFLLGRFVALVLGTSLVIAAACVINNYLDREIDIKMSRTNKRPSVTGIVSVGSGSIYAIGLLLAGFGLLAAYTNLLTVIIGVIGLIDYVVLYGIAKRRTIYGTVVGSVSGAVSIVAGYTAVSGRLDTAALILFLIMVFWQMPHFYAIAIFRSSDYLSANLPVLPLVKGVERTRLEIILYILAFIAAIAALTLTGYAGDIYLFVMTALGVYWLLKALAGFRAKDNARWAKQMFGLSLLTMTALAVMVPLGARLP